MIVGNNFLSLGRKTFPNVLRSRQFLSSLAGTKYTVKEITIPAPHGHISGRLWEGAVSKDEPKPLPMICTHGWLDNCGSFDTLLPLIMRPNMVAFTPELPGHGFSSPYVTPSHYDLGFEGILMLLRCLRHFEWNKVSILGHSLGAVIAFIFSSTYPEHVHNYISMDSYIDTIDPDLRKSLKRICKSILQTDDKLAKGGKSPTYTYDQILKKMIEARQGTITEEGCKVLLKRGSEEVAGEPGKFRFNHDLKVTIPVGEDRLTMEQLESVASGTKCPVCVMVRDQPGTEGNDRANMLTIFEFIKKNGQKVEFHRIAGTHHFHLNDPHKVAPIITNFLSQTA